MEGEGIEDEGVDVADSLGTYCRCRLVVRGLDRRKVVGHNVLHSVVLAGVDLQQAHGLALRQYSEKVGKQHVEADWFNFGADFWGVDGRFFIDTKDFPCEHNDRIRSNQEQVQCKLLSNKENGIYLERRRRAPGRCL